VLDALISRYVRSLNQRLMTFRAPPGHVALPAPDPDRRYLLYLHIPFCVVLCPFCSFHRVEFREKRARAYFEALRAEVRRVSGLGYRFGEVYVGGGTPTVLPDELAETLTLVRELHPVGAISAETNPLDLNADTMQGLKSAGLTRLSVGVQSFDNGLLREMERYDKYGSGDQVREHLRNMQGIFDTLNVDMIFNFPHQDRAMLDADLATLTGELSVDQVSWYPLMTTDSTARPMARSIGTVDRTRERGLYEVIARHMLDAGYQRSSAWCFSRRPGMFDEYIVEHEEYVGLGSGSFSYVGGTMFASTFSINHYLDRIDAGGTGIVRQRGMNRVEQMRYFLLMQLFGGELSLDEAEQRFGGAFERTLWRDLAGLRMLGAIETRGRTIRLTESGYYLWVILMREFFSGVNNFRDGMRQSIRSENRPDTADYG
jgi:coproporphyrinogen III oxidase-like Fe-S oxidoreductase